MEDFTLSNRTGLTNLNCRPKSKIFKDSLREFLKLKFISLVLFNVLFFSSSVIWAQDTVGDIFNLPDSDRCVSNDLRVVEATLDFDLCGPVCEEGEIIEYPLTLAIFNNTGSLRTSFAFFARLEQYNPDGSLEHTYFISGCKGPVPPNTTTELTFDESLEILDENGEPTEFDGVPYLCGGSLKLINLYEAWTDASDNDNRQCPLEASKIAPKCDVLPSIEIQTPISAFVENTTDVSCFGGNDGSIDITVSGGTPPYTYEWSKVGGGFSASTQDVMNLTAGTYEVTITDFEGCSVTLDGIVIDEPEILDADITPINVSCFGGNDGSIVISNPSGGSGGYEYSIDGGSSWQASGSFTNLEADFYNVQIRDANATECVIVLDANLEIEEPDILDADIMGDDVSCFGESDGSISISNPTGGSGSYEYSINGGTDWQASGVFTGLAAGFYDIQIRDANAIDCIITLDDDFEIDEPDVLDADVDSDDVTCNGEAGGSISITNPSGGSGSYEYSINGGVDWQVSGEFTGLPAGIYNVQIRDANAINCLIILDDDLEIEQPFTLAADVDPDDVTCFGESDGSITISNPTGGSGSYEYSINGGTDWQANGSFTGLGPDSYNVQIRDANAIECVITLDEDLIIEEPPLLDQPSLQIPPNECFSDPGNFIITSDTEGLLFQIDDGPFVAYPEGGFVGVSVGLHTITAKNQDGCLSEPLEFEIFPPFSTPVMPILDAIQPTCDVLTGTILVTNHVEGQTYSVRLTSDISEPVFVDYPMGGFPGLAPGDYIVIARSADECSSDAAFITLFEATNCDEFEGCTLGYWKNHTDRWCDAYTTCTLYNSVFAESTLSPELTLLQALNLNGNTAGENLARQSVASLLNICSEDVSFNSEFATIAALQDYVNAAFTSGALNDAGSHLDFLNNAGCPLGGSRATTASTCQTLRVSSFDAEAIDNSFRAYPVPFGSTLNVQYDFDYSSVANIQIFDLQGRMLRSYVEKDAYNGKVTELVMDFRTIANQVYILKVTTDRDVFTKKIISAK